MQTNGFLEYGKQYQHNKYVIVDEKTVFCGAGNFTEAAFGTGFSPGSYWMANYENFYLIRDANVAAQYLEHFNKLHRLAPAAENLPSDDNF